jgi:uncharacterized membrane protein required for colicin V production
MPSSTIDHIITEVTTQTTDRLLIYVLGLFLIFLIISLVMLWRAFPLIREGNKARFEQARAYDKNTEIITAMKDELGLLRKSFEEHYPKSFYRWIMGR